MKLLKFRFKRSKSLENHNTILPDMPFDLENIKDHLENAINLQNENIENQSMDTEFIDPETTYTQTTNYFAEELNKAIQRCNHLSQNYEELQEKYENITLKTNKLESENKEIKEICDTLNQSKEQHKYRSKIAKYLPPNIIKTLDPVIHRDYISSFYDPNKASRDSSISCDINHVMNNVEEKNSSLDTHDLLRKIVHEEFLNLKTEANLGTCELLTTQCNLASNPNNINYEKVANIIYKKRLAIPYTLKQIGCKDFIKSYPPNNFKNCSQQEYNLVLTQLMGNDTKDALLAHNVKPTELSTTEFINELFRLSENDTSDEMILEKKIYEFTSNEVDICKILSDINVLIDRAPYWTEESKSRKLFFTIKKFLSDNIIPHLNNLLIFNSLTKQNVYPSRQKIREFVRRHQFEIDRELLKKRKKIYIVNNPHDSQPDPNNVQEINYIDEVEKERLERLLEKNDRDESEKERENDIHMKKPETRYNSMIESQNRRYYNNNNFDRQINRNPQNNSFERQPQEFRQNQSNNYDNRQPYFQRRYQNNYQNGSFNRNQTFNRNQKFQDRRDFRPQPRKDQNCTFCNGFTHTDEKCFFHPNKEIAVNNQKSRAQRCLNCSEAGHIAFDCENYKDIVPIPINCGLCKKKGKINYHPAHNCKDQ